MTLTRHLQNHRTHLTVQEMRLTLPEGNLECDLCFNFEQNKCKKSQYSAINEIIGEERGHYIKLAELKLNKSV